MSKQKSALGVVLCAPCPKQDLERITAKLGSNLLTAEVPATPRQLADLAAKVAKHGFAKVLLAGISPVRQAELIRSFTRQVRLSPGAVLGLDLDPALHAKGRAAAIRRAIDAGLAALTESPLLETRREPLQAAVVVVGGGPAGLQAASSLRALGHPVTIVEKEAGNASGIVRQAFDLKGATLLTGSRVMRIEGQVGAFTVTVRTPQGGRRLACGAVVLTVGAVDVAPGGTAMLNTAGVVPLGELADAAGRLPRRRGVRSLALILDYRFDETKASTEGALQAALELQNKGFQAHLFCRDVRVAAMELEKLYDQAREAGVDIVKYDGELELSPASGKAVQIAYRDGILGQRSSLECELAGVSPYGIASAADPEVASLFGVTTDALGQLQANNIHLFPGETNRPGIFAAGACRGQFYLPQLRAEAKAVALAVHSLLSPGALEVELAQPVVDADKCALCLTCIRSCPHGAMFIDRAKGAAASSPEACRRCGICAGECPAKAIELPAWSDRVVLSQVR